MKTKPVLIVAGYCLLTGNIAKATKENNVQNPNHPNIIFILTDDMGIGDIGAYGGKIIETPYIDKMAAEGIRFNKFYCASPISSPSRAGFLTGRHPANWNITSYLQTREGNRNAEMADFLTPDAHTLPRVLKDVGYKTAHFGKWHLGGGRDVHNAPSIKKYGYDEYVSTYESPNPDPLLTATDWIWSAEDSIKRWDRTAYFIDKTLAFLKNNKETPCFINLWPDDVHTPWIGNEEEMGQSPQGTNSKKNFKTVMEVYDQQIGQLLKSLKEEGLDKNTIVIFTSDNGPAPTFGHDRNNGLRGQKASLFEGGIRMPFIVWGPDAHIPMGIVNDLSVISALDIFSTICSLTNSNVPKDLNSDGEDMSEALLGNSKIRTKNIFWEYRRNDSNAFPKPSEEYNVSPNIAVLHENWKLLVNKDGSNVLLFDLNNDINETTNLMNDFPKVTEKLKKEALEWRKSLPAYENNN